MEIRPDLAPPADAPLAPTATPAEKSQDADAAPSRFKQALAEVEQNRLPSIPLEPGESVEDDLSEDDEENAPTGEPSVHGPRIDLLANFIDLLLLLLFKSRSDRRDADDDR